MIRALAIQVLCFYKQWHDTGTKRTGICRRCGLKVGPDGRADV